MLSMTGVPALGRPLGWTRGLRRPSERSGAPGAGTTAGSWDQPEVDVTGKRWDEASMALTK